MGEPSMWDTRTCPRCKRVGLMCYGPWHDGDGFGPQYRYACSSCDRWFSPIELLRTVEPDG